MSAFFVTHNIALNPHGFQNS